jgi:hypothetical protein
MVTSEIGMEIIPSAQPRVSAIERNKVIAAYDGGRTQWKTE